MGLGVVLRQNVSRLRNRPIAYTSRELTPAEVNYSVTLQETIP